MLIRVLSLTLSILVISNLIRTHKPEIPRKHLHQAIPEIDTSINEEIKYAAR